MMESLTPLLTTTLGSTPGHPERGERVILRRPSTIQVLGGDVAPPTALQLAEDALFGALTLSLELPTGGAMGGVVVAGATLTLAGSTYTVAADAQVVGTSFDVALVTGLQADAVAGAAVVLTPEAVFTLEDCHVARRSLRGVARELQADHLANVTLPCKGAPVTPRLNDSLELEDGTVGRVSSDVIGGGAFWKLQMGL